MFHVVSANHLTLSIPLKGFRIYALVFDTLSGGLQKALRKNGAWERLKNGMRNQETQPVEPQYSDEFLVGMLCPLHEFMTYFV